MVPVAQLVLLGFICFQISRFVYNFAYLHVQVQAHSADEISTILTTSAGSSFAITNSTDVNAVGNLKYRRPQAAASAENINASLSNLGAEESHGNYIDVRPTRAGLEYKVNSTARLNVTSDHNNNISFNVDLVTIISGRKIKFKLPPSIGDHKHHNRILDHMYSDIERSSMIVGVISSCKHRERRDLVRDSWAKKRLLYFIVGKSENCSAEFEYWEEEDIILVDVVESYNENANSVLPLKSQLWFHVADRFFNGTYKWLMKTDDDSYVYVGKLTSALKKMHPKPHYWGECFREGFSRIIRDPTKRWYVPRSMWNEERFPAYCAGSGYILSNELVSCAAKQLPNFRFMSMEDVATGILAKKCRYKPYSLNSRKFESFKRKTPRLKNRFLFHPIRTKQDMLALLPNNSASATTYTVS